MWGLQDFGILYYALEGCMGSFVPVGMWRHQLQCNRRRRYQRYQLSVQLWTRVSSLKAYVVRWPVVHGMQNIYIIVAILTGSYRTRLVSAVLPVPLHTTVATTPAVSATKLSTYMTMHGIFNASLHLSPLVPSVDPPRVVATETALSRGETLGGNTLTLTSIVLVLSVSFHV